MCVQSGTSAFIAYLLRFLHRTLPFWYVSMPQTLAEICRNMGICRSFRAVATREIYPGSDLLGFASFILIVWFFPHGLYSCTGSLPSLLRECGCLHHDDVIKWKHFPRFWPFVRGIHRSRWIPRTKASDAELWCFFFYLRLNKRLSKQPWGWWFETPGWSLWRDRNGNVLCLHCLYDVFCLHCLWGRFVPIDLISVLTTLYRSLCDFAFIV